MGDLLDLRRQDDHRTFFAIVDSKTGPYQVPISKRLRKALDKLEPDPQGSDFYFWWRCRAKTDRDRRSVVRKVLRVAWQSTFAMLRDRSTSSHRYGGQPSRGLLIVSEQEVGVSWRRLACQP